MVHALNLVVLEILMDLNSIIAVTKLLLSAVIRGVTVKLLVDANVVGYKWPFTVISANALIKS